MKKFSDKHNIDNHVAKKSGLDVSGIALSALMHKKYEMFIDAVAMAKVEIHPYFGYVSDQLKFFNILVADDRISLSNQAIEKLFQSVELQEEFAHLLIEQFVNWECIHELHVSNRRYLKKIMLKLFHLGHNPMWDMEFIDKHACSADLVAEVYKELKWSLEPKHVMELFEKTIVGKYPVEDFINILNDPIDEEYRGFADCIRLLKECIYKCSISSEDFVDCIISTFEISDEVVELIIQSDRDIFDAFMRRAKQSITDFRSVYYSVAVRLLRSESQIPVIPQLAYGAIVHDIDLPDYIYSHPEIYKVSATTMGKLEHIIAIAKSMIDLGVSSDNIDKIIDVLLS